MKLKKILFSEWLLGGALLLLILAGTLIEVPLLEVPECRLYDALTDFRPPEKDSPVSLVAIDRDSLGALGQWPWPRAHLADMLEFLHASGAKAIGVALPLGGRENNPGLDEVRQLLKELPDSANETVRLLTRSAQRSDGDARLVRTVRNAGNVVFSFGLTQEPSAPPLSPALLARSGVRLPERPLPSDRAPGLDFLGRFAPGGMLQVPSPAGPFPELAAASGGLGCLDFIPDADGTVRRLPLVVSGQGAVLPCLPLLMTANSLNLSPKKLILADGPEFTGVIVGDKRIPSDHRWRMLVDFGGNGGNFSTYSFAAVKSGEVPAEAFRNRIVILGPAGPGTGFLRTPLASNTGGAEMVAAALSDLLGDKPLRRPLWALTVETAVLLYFFIFLLLLIPRIHLLAGVTLMGLFLVTWYGVASYLFIHEGVWFKVFPATLLAFLGIALTSSRRRLRVRRAEYAELNRMLGLSYQGQGMLDHALEKFMRCPVEDPQVRDSLYNLGLDFERKRMFNRAEAVYRHILKEGRFRDVRERIARLGNLEGTVLFGGGGRSREATMVLEGSARPTLGRYEILRELGQGAMGTVYLGKDPKINREVAIKTLDYGSLDPVQLEEVKQRFFREAEAAGKLVHPNIVTIYDAGEEHDMAYLAMEYLAGRTLAEYCRRENLLPTARVLEILAAIAEALDYAHSHGVVHRDIKPANIMLLDSGQVKVADFGIARIMSSSETQTGVILGTPSYMSPEQVAGRKVDGRSDLFSLGAVGFEMLTGEKPFQGESLAALMYNISNASYEPLETYAPGLPSCCGQVVEKLLAKSPARRYRSARDAADQIRGCLASIE